MKLNLNKIMMRKIFFFSKLNVFKTALISYLNRRLKNKFLKSKNLIIISFFLDKNECCCLQRWWSWSGRGGGRALGDYNIGVETNEIDDFDLIDQVRQQNKGFKLPDATRLMLIKQLTPKNNVCHEDDRFIE